MTPQSQNQTTSQHQAPSRSIPRGGFTLIELMVVIVIIAVLVGIITPAVMGALRKAREAEVSTEISQLNTAIGAFQVYGGITPPSYINFPDLTGTDTWDDAAFARSKSIIRRIWPQFNFATNGGNTALSGELNGAECLVFFLGGIQKADGSLIGFSTNPAEPFTLTGSRDGPFFQFKTARLTVTGAGTSGNPKAPEYLDSLPSQSQPLIYLSSYDGRGYRSQDGMKLATDLGTSNAPWYTLSGGAPYNSKSYQIISPGADRAYGNGGVYDSKNYAAQTAADGDNIANFRGGRLVP